MHSAITITFLFLLPAGPIAAAGSTPEVTVHDVRRVFHNGEHNAFTDLCRFKGRFYLTFRSCPSGHAVDSAASVIVLVSDNAKIWKQVHQFAVPQRDTRDPHFLAFNDKLFVYTGTWWSGDGPLARDDPQYDLNKHLGYATFTDNGTTWSEPHQLEGTYGHYIWRAATRDGVAYLCARRKKEYSEKASGAGGTDIVQSAILQSKDGLHWRFHSLVQETLGNETAFQFLDDDSLLAVSRSKGQSTQLARATPPYQAWTRTRIPLAVGGPLVAKWGDRILVAGRRSGDDGGPVTALYWLDENDELQLFAKLPSGGDNSYPGFVELSPTRALVSWYSTH
jgi:hypothetical protein